MAVKRSVKYNYESLANAIVKQAYDDYIASMKPIAPGKDQLYKRSRAVYLRDDCESFFRGEWYTTLTALPPEILIKAAITEKQKGIVYDWLSVLMATKKGRRIRKRTINMHFADRKKAGNALVKKIRKNLGICEMSYDSRRAEYAARKKWRKSRIKKEEKRKN